MTTTEAAIALAALVAEFATLLGVIHIIYIKPMKEKFKDIYEKVNANNADLKVVISEVSNIKEGLANHGDDTEKLMDKMEKISQGLVRLEERHKK